MNYSQTISAIALLIREIFPDITVYTEQIQQGFVRPCFTVTAQESEKPIIGARVSKRIDCTITRYASKNEDAAEAGRHASQELSLALEWIDVAGVPRHCVLQSYVVDIEKRITEIKVRYCTHILKKRDVTKMRELEHIEKVR